MFPNGWPADLCTYITETWGEPTSVTRLSGIGGPGAYRVSATRGDVIGKCDPRGREAQFYEHVAPPLRARGVPVPDLYWSGPSGAHHWLVLEAIPHPLPRSRWSGDAGVMAALVRLHRSPLDQVHPDMNLYRPQWTDALTEAAVSCLAPADAGPVRARLRELQERSQNLFAPTCLISGDPNPTNWGMRQDESVVLFDWERFGLGAPAIDIAITMPGLLSSDGERESQIAASYLGQLAEYGDGSPVAPLERFVTDIRRAKLWTAVEFLSNYAEGKLPAHAQTTAEWLLTELPRISAAVV